MSADRAVPVAIASYDHPIPWQVFAGGVLLAHEPTKIMIQEAAQAGSYE